MHNKFSIFPPKNKREKVLQRLQDDGCEID